MPASAAPVPQPPAVPTWLPVDEMLGCVLEVSLTGLVFYLPVYDPADASKVVDFRFAHLNPAAQRMLRLPPAPANSFLQQFPDTLTNGSFAYHRDTFLSGELRNFEQYYQSGGYDNFFRVAGRRAGEGLLVSFTDTSDRPRSAVEEALRASQVREQAAYAASIAQHEQLRNVLQQAPVAIALLEGRNYHITLANPPVCEIWARTEAQLLGRPLLEAMPELQGQGVDTLLDGVLDSGEPYTGTELPFQLVRHGCLDTIYFNFVYQPQRDAQGTVTGVLVVAHNVTEQVLSRQLIEQQERATSELNEELAVANEEIRANNDELMRAHQDLRNLNEELEARVAERTHELTEALQEAQRHREQIRTQERYLQQILGQVPASLATLSGPEHRFTFFNEHYQQLAGHRVQLGRTVAETLPEVVGQGFIELLNNVYATGEPFIGIEMAAQLYNPATGRNEQRYIDFIYQPLVDRHGRANDILAFIVDTTDKVLSRQRVEESQRQLRLLTDALPVLIAYIDHEQKYQFVNQAYQAWFGHEPAAMQGRTVRELVGQEAYAEVKGYVEQALTGQRIDFEARMQYRKDFVRHIHTSYVPDIQDGQVAGFFSLVVDVSDQVEARQQVQSLNEDLAAINEELLASNEELGDKNQQLTRVNVDLDNFIYTASHDLKAPISNIEGLLYLLREELPANVMTDETVGIILTRMLDSVERFKRTIEHLTDVSKLQKEHGRPSEAADLAAVIEDVRLDLEPLLRETDACLQVNVTDMTPILFPEKNLRSVVYNLLSNALKYRSPDRRVHVDVRSHVVPGFTVLEVHDNGLGIDAAQQPKLFGMFQRFHDHVEGSGIGLYMVKKMVENAGGRIDVHSQLGAGTTFFVYLRHAPASLA